MSAELFVRVTDAGRHQPFRMVGATHRLDVGPSFATPREAIDYCNRAATNRTRPDAENAPEVAPDGGSRSASPVSGAQRASYAEGRS